ncbi:MAG: hypothetical protein ACE3JK_01900 [Sporolactobacillus sp.]
MGVVAIIIAFLMGLVMVISIFSFIIGLVNLSVPENVHNGKAFLKNSTIAFVIALIVLIISIAVISIS